MRKICPLIITGLLISCGQHHQNTQSTVTADTLKANDKIEMPDATSAADEDDCMFNNDYKGLTTGWLKKLGIQEFVWKDNLNQALIPRGQDTIFLSQGGCTHFGFFLQIKLANDSHALTDSSYFIQKAFELATEFEMDHYAKMIKEGKLRKIPLGGTGIWYEIEDDNMDDNIFYNGIEISTEERNKKINITQYMN